MASEMRAAARARGRTIKRSNALTAILFGGLLALVLARAFPPTPSTWLVGFLVGLLYADGFEYFFHRFLLHWPGTRLTQEHLVHHDTLGAPDEALYVNFFGSPWIVVLVFAVNALPFVALEGGLRLGMGAGVLVGFVVYFIACEELHWRFHLGGSLPAWLRAAQRHHLVHHGQPGERFNVFLPLFDRLLGPGKR